jgi:heme exporter protein A
MSSPPSAVEAAGLVRSFGSRRAVDGVTFSLSPGDCLTVFGPNGAGKTTLLRVVAGLLRPTEGRVLVRGHELREDGAARAGVGLISHQSMLYGALTARENVEFAARLYGVADPRAAADEVLTRMRIAGRSETRVRALSRGLQQRVSIARAIVHAPTMVLLDEPYTGLDAAGGAALTEMLSELRAGGATMVLVTHNVDEGLALATHAAIMLCGRFVRSDGRDAIDPTRYGAEYRSLVIADSERGSSAAARAS